MKIVVSGGTGFIGKTLLKKLVEAGHQVVLLARNPDAVKQLASASMILEPWDGRSVGRWADRMENIDAVINLSGEPVVGKRWNEEQKTRILKSRIDATRALTSAMAQCRKRPSVFVNASAVGYYGDVPSGEVTESSPKGKGFLGDTCDEWEQTARSAEAWGIRVVLLRIGIVLEKDGGALQKMIPPFTFFAGGPLGSGRQWLPWVHRDDVVGMILFALENSSVRGPVNATAPNPVTMKEFCATLGKVMRRPSWAPVPAFLLRLLLGEMSEVLLSGQRVIPKKLKEAGYTFRYSLLEEALAAIFKKSPYDS